MNNNRMIAESAYYNSEAHLQLQKPQTYTTSMMSSCSW